MSQIVTPNPTTSAAWKTGAPGVYPILIYPEPAIDNHHH